MLRWGERLYPWNFAKFLPTNYTEQNTLSGKGKTLSPNIIFIIPLFSECFLSYLFYWISFQLLIFFTFWKERKEQSIFADKSNQSLIFLQLHTGPFFVWSEILTLAREAQNQFTVQNEYVLVIIDLSLRKIPQLFKVDHWPYLYLKSTSKSPIKPWIIIIY